MACFATLIALFYAEEDWRGKHDWEKFKRAWEAKGEHFDFASVIPPPVPDDRNFAFSPVWIAEEKYNFQNTPEKARAWYGDRIDDAEISKIEGQFPVSLTGLVGTNWSYHLPARPDVSGQWTLARVTDLKPWQSYYRNLERTNSAAEISITPQPQSAAADVLLALGKFDPVFEQLRADSARPDSRFPIQYEGMPAAILLPHLAPLKQCSQVLQLRAIAELQNNESQKALDDMKLSLRLTEAIRTEPFLISHLVRIAILQITLEPIYEGLAERKWSNEQLADLDAELAKLDFLADYKFSMRGELGFQGGMIDFLIHNRRELFDLSAENNNELGMPPFLNPLIPTGWFYQNRLNCARMMVEFYVPLADENQESISPSAVRRADDALLADTKKTTPYNILEKMLLPALGNAVKKFAYAQSSANLARVAIALERYRLAHGEFPGSLDALAPPFLEKIPHDIINGQPLHYRRTDDGQFVLYSVGWNETDDGDLVVTDKKTGTVHQDEGDWVWRYSKDE